VKTAEGAN
jgi:hypothetical protein